MNRPKDQIERLFQERLGDEHDGDGWDLPSGEVWDNIASSLAVRQRRRRLGWILVFGGVLLVLAGYGIFGMTDKDSSWQKHDTPSSATATEDHAEALLTPHAEQVTTPRHIPPTTGERPAVKADVIDKAETAAGDERIRTASSPAKRALPATIDSKTAPAVVEKSRTAKTHAAPPDGRNIAEGNVRDPVQVMSHTVLASPAGLAHHPAYVLPDDRVVHRIPLVITRARAPGRWILGMYVAPAFSTRHIQVPPNRPALRKALLQKEEESIVRLDFGMSAEYRAGYRWNVGVGVEYADFHLRSMYTRQIRHTRAGETVNDRGNLENKYAVNIQTSYGRVSTDVVVERTPGAVLPEHAFITFSMPVRQSMQMVRIPVYAQYRLTDGRIPLYVRGGLSMQILLDNNLDVRGVVSLSSTVDRIRTLHDGSVKGARQTTLGYQAAIGSDIPVGNGWALSIEASTSGATQPLYRHDELRVFPVSTELRVGVSYQLQ